MKSNIKWSEINQLGDKKLLYEITVKALVKYNSNAPDVDFGGYFRWCLANDETLRWEVPVSAGTLGRQIHSMLRVVIILVHDFGKAEIRDLNVATYAAVA